MPLRSVFYTSFAGSSSCLHSANAAIVNGTIVTLGLGLGLELEQKKTFDHSVEQFRPISCIAFAFYTPVLISYPKAWKCFRNASHTLIKKWCMVDSHLT